MCRRAVDDRSEIGTQNWAPIARSPTEPVHVAPELRVLARVAVGVGHRDARPRERGLAPIPSVREAAAPAENTLVSPPFLTS